MKLLRWLFTVDPELVKWGGKGVTVPPIVIVMFFVVLFLLAYFRM